MSTFWSVFIIIGTLGSIAFYVYVLMANRKTTNKPGETTGHNYDGIEELDNPLPAWWFWKFILLVIFGLGYLIYYPGLGNFKGVGNWTSASELKQDILANEAKFAPLYAKYRDIKVEDMHLEVDAMKMGQRLFANNCAICHGSTATGGEGFPNLTDKVWLWGGKGADIETTIAHGRTATMPAHGATYSEEQVWDLISYVVSLGGKAQDADKVASGKVMYEQTCFACHGINGKGNVAMGAPDLTNDVWLYGGARTAIGETITKGRVGVMPAFTDRLGEDKVHILAGYIYSLSAQK